MGLKPHQKNPCILLFRFRGFELAHGLHPTSIRERVRRRLLSEIAIGTPED